MRSGRAGASVEAMSENLPESFDPRQPDLPTLAVDPDPLPDTPDGEPPTNEPDEPTAAT